MKFLLMVLAIRYVFVLLDRMLRDEELDEGVERETFIHPSEYRTRW